MDTELTDLFTCAFASLQDPSSEFQNIADNKAKKKVKQKAKKKANKQTRQLDDKISEEIIIAFVKDLEKAHQYFEYKKYVRSNCLGLNGTSDSDEMAYILNEEKEKTSNEFHLLDEDDIYYCVKQYIDALRLPSPEGVDALSLDYFDIFAVRDPIYYLLQQALAEGYALDDKPENELIRIKRFAPFHYEACYADRKPPVDKEARTVMVDGIPNDIDEKDIRRFFRACGCIEFFEIRRASEEDQTAYITYADIDGARSALKLDCTGKDRKNPHSSWLKGSQLLSWIPLTVQLRSGQDVIAEPVEKAIDVSTMYAEALAKYSDIKSHYSQFESNNGNPFKDADYFRIEWMAINAFVNGEFTFGGTPVQDLKFC